MNEAGARKVASGLAIVVGMSEGMPVRVSDVFEMDGTWWAVFVDRDGDSGLTFMREVWW